MKPPLPIDEHLPTIVRALAREHAAVLTAPPGAGKTTRVPPALLGAIEGRIVMLEPRRVAVRAAARRMAHEGGWQLGREVGYQVRFDRVACAETRILVVTEGVGVRMLHDDPLLEGVGALLLDEFHERSMVADLALAMARHVQQQVRPDLAIGAMSATLDPAPVAAFLGGCPVIDAPGRSHPVGLCYLAPPDRDPLPRAVARGVRQALDQGPGDLLVFLPGVGEIRRTAEELAATADARDLVLVPLYGDLPPDQQDAALKPASRRKVILATNVAETSITVEGVGTVVDSGYARVLRHDPAVGLDRLELARIGRASADQRAGRAGRTGPGSCLRLWREEETAHLPPAELPEIQRVDLAGPALTLLAWGEDPAAFGWFEAPDGEALGRALELLTMLGALDDGTLTPLGRRMARLPLHPRLARLVVEGHALGHGRDACLLAAMLSERSVLRRREFGDEGPRTRSGSDPLDRLAAVMHVANPDVPSPYGRSEVLEGIARRVLQVGRQLVDLTRRLPAPDRRQDDPDEALSRTLLVAYPDRVARRREPGSPRAVMVGGRGVRLARESAVLDAELFVCVELSAGRRGDRAEALVRQASEVDEAWLPAHLFTDDVVVRFDPDSGRAGAREQRRYADVVLADRPCQAPDPALVAEALAVAAAADPPRALDLEDREVREFLSRLAFLATHQPQLGLPDPDVLLKEQAIPALAAGRSTFAELRRAPLLATLKGLMPHHQLVALDREAPERLQVPSGSRIRLAYSADAPPVLAARIQELFGLADTPRVAGGAVPVMVHLLAPNMRPQQVTQDLRSFWDTTYPEVRKELRARYPKHDWPEDPWTAKASKRPGRRRRRPR